TASSSSVDQWRPAAPRSGRSGRDYAATIERTWCSKLNGQCRVGRCFGLRLIGTPPSDQWHLSGTTLSHGTASNALHPQRGGRPSRVQGDRQRPARLTLGIGVVSHLEWG